MGYCEYPVCIWPYSELWILYATISDRLYVIIPRPDMVEVKVSIKSGFFPLLSLHCLCFCVTTKQDLSSLAAGTGSAGVRNVPKREHVYKRKALPPLSVDVSRQLFPSFPSLCFLPEIKAIWTSLCFLFLVFFWGGAKIYLDLYVIILT